MGYSTGLFGDARYGVGGFYFDSTCISAYPLSGNTPLEVTFVALQDGGFDNPLYIWDFGDGTSANGYDSSAVHIYSAVGNYQPTLSISAVEIGQSYINDNFNNQSANAGWDSDFTSNWTTFSEYATGEYAIVKGDSGYNSLTNQPMSGDFTIDFIGVFGSDNDGDDSYGIGIDSNSATAVPDFRISCFGGDIRWDSSCSGTVLVPFAFSAFATWEGRIQRVGDTITGYINNGSGLEEVGYCTYSADDLYVVADGADKHGWGGISAISDGGLPYSYPATVTSCSGDSITVTNPPSHIGHIGAFYFGPSERIVSADPIDMTLAVIDPTVVALTSTSILGELTNLVSYLVVQQPTVIAVKDINVDFVGVPRVGSSPLIVDFTAIVTFGSGYIGNINVTEYKWYFDYTNNPTVYETSTTPEITHVYNGYNGQKFSVKLEVVLGVT